MLALTYLVMISPAVDSDHLVQVVSHRDHHDLGHVLAAHRRDSIKAIEGWVLFIHQ